LSHPISSLIILLIATATRTTYCEGCRREYVGRTTTCAGHGRIVDGSPSRALATLWRDYGTAIAGITGWAIFGTALAVFRSVPLALGIGFAWAGPFENIVVDSWSTGYRVFPGQVLGSLIRGGTLELTLTRAIVTAVAYTAIAAAVALILVVRRDVTS
jgi:hypothetical protein